MSGPVWYRIDKENDMAKTFVHFITALITNVISA
jgi:hypothetical protein